MAFELLPLLAGIRVDSHEHPEGDLFYHSCQVFEAGLQLEPHDTEFLEACLFHDLGWIQNFKKPQEASVYILKGIATPRTLFFIQELPVAHEYLKSGKIKNSLRKSTDFDLLIELARLDRKCRIPGADVQELDAIEEYLQQYGD